MKKAEGTRNVEIGFEKTRNHVGRRFPTGWWRVVKVAGPIAKSTAICGSRDRSMSTDGG